MYFPISKHEGDRGAHYHVLARLNNEPTVQLAQYLWQAKKPNQTKLIELMRAEYKRGIPSCDDADVESSD